MREDKRRRLEAKGWKVGRAAEFLALTPSEAEFVELKVALSRWLRVVRRDQSLTQQALARLLQSSQSRVAKMEAGDPSVTLDLLVRSLVVLGATAEDIAKAITGRTPASPKGRPAESANRRGRSTGVARRQAQRGHRAA
jgi:transcriptional regulator with XRE-family HTH domain